MVYVLLRVFGAVAHKLAFVTALNRKEWCYPIFCRLYKFVFECKMCLLFYFHNVNYIF